MTPRRTMSIAQQLYEGVDIAGEGAVGLITYMRTDSLRLSDEALEAAKTYIVNHYGPEYYPGDHRHLQDQGRRSGRPRGHPSHRCEPEPGRLCARSLTPEQYKLYKLIWSRFIACQMANARIRQRVH